MTNSLDIQTRIARAVEARGYRQGWTDEQYIARQICKASEELAEAAGDIGINYDNARDVWYWSTRLGDAGLCARSAFDQKDQWQSAEIPLELRSYMALEIADTLIPLLVAATILGVDVLALAVEKAEKDIARGVRGEQE